MRPRLLLPFLMAPVLAGPALMGQSPFQGDAAEARMAKVRADQDPAVPAFLLLFPKGQRFQGDWELDPDYSRVASCREITYAEFSEGETRAWATYLGWEPGDHWLLLSPEGRPLLSGATVPKAAALLDAMRGTGWTPRFERLDQFLREHPDNGEAWDEALLSAVVAVSRRVTVEQRLSGKPFNMDERVKEMENPTPLTSDQDQAKWGSVAESLRGAMGVEDWQIRPNQFLVLSRLVATGAKASLILKDPLRRMEQGLEAALREHPSDRGLWDLWYSFDNLTPISDPEALLASLAPLPRSPWPPEPACLPLVMAFERRGDFAGLEDLAARAYARGMDPAVSLYQGRDFRVRMVRSWGWARLIALMHLGRKDEANGFVNELRTQAGGAWPGIAGDDFARSLEYGFGKDDPLVQLPKAAKNETAPPDPPMPAFPPAPHLALLGHPAWERAWNGYAALSAFDAWEPGEELGWQPLKPKDEKALRARMSWGAEPRWVLLRGEAVLASGTELPKPSFIADRLRAEGLPYLEQLDAFIRTHPDHLEAREARMDALRSRMPNERLEATLLEDARATFAPFHPGAGAVMPMVADWKPRKELWEPAARRVLPELEARLRRWPERKELWEAWLDWAQVSADPPSPARMMEGLAIWKTRTGGGAGPLPDEVLAAVSKHLNDEERWKELADWCRAFWEGGVRDELVRLALPLPGGGRRDRERRGQQAELYTRALLVPYRTALEKLGRAAQLRAFLEDVKTADPSLARKLTASASSPHPG